MLVFMIVAVALQFLLLVAIMAVCLYLCYCFFLLADRLGISLSVYARWKARRLERVEKEKKDSEYTDMLEKLCERSDRMEKKELEEDILTFDELDRPGGAVDIEQPETDPDSLMTLLEFGLPDEELESVLSALEKE